MHPETRRSFIESYRYHRRFSNTRWHAFLLAYWDLRYRENY